MIALTVKQWIILGGMAAVLGVGWYARDTVQKRADFKNVKGQVTTLQNQGERYDAAVAEKLREDARIDAGVAKAQNKNREAARHEPQYRAYLDRPLPAASVRLYRDAAKAIAAAEHPGADDSGAKADEGTR